MILISSFVTFRNVSPAYGADDDIVVELEIRLHDLKELDKMIQEHEVLKSLAQEQANKITELEKALVNEQKTNELNQREIDLQKQIISLKDMEIAATNKALADMKDVADRAIKLAETSKPTNNIWTIVGAIIGGIALGLAIGAL